MGSIGEKIYYLRKKKGLSQEELGYEIGVARQTISKWEANSMNPNTENIKQLCEVFGVTADYFISEEEIVVAAACETQSVTAKKSRRKILTVLTSILSVINAVLIIIVGIVGRTAFPTNKGDTVIIAEGAQQSSFFILCVVLAIFVIAEIIIVYLLIKKKK